MQEPATDSAGLKRLLIPVSGVRGPCYIQNASVYHGKLKGWTARFNGMAMDDLENHPGWFRAFDQASKERSIGVNAQQFPGRE